jgi:hypothetical protein
MPGKHWIVAREKRDALGAPARLTAEQLPDEHERRPMRQSGEVISDR